METIMAAKEAALTRGRYGHVIESRDIPHSTRAAAGTGPAATVLRRREIDKKDFLKNAIVNFL